MMYVVIGQCKVRSSCHAQPAFHEATYLHMHTGCSTQLRDLFAFKEAGRFSQLDVEHAAGFELDQSFGIMLVATAFVGHDGNGGSCGNLTQLHKTPAQNGFLAMLDVERL